jgi:propanol-preferring alcohol dehydrogenase
VGDKISIPLFPLVAREFTYHGSFWGNYTDLSEVMALAQERKIKHTIKRIHLEDVNENLDLVRDGEVVGRAVIVYSEPAVPVKRSRADAHVAQLA